MNLNSVFLKSVIFCFLTLTFFVAEGKQIPDRPNPARLVNDFTNTLSNTEINQLERKLVAYDDSTSNQFAIVIENTLDDDDLFDYSYRIARDWDIGRKGKWNGLLIYVAVQDRKIGIHVGQGLQGTIPDALAKRIINNIIRPAFREGQYYVGLDRATSTMIDLASGEFQNDEPAEKEFPWEVLIVIAAIILIIYSNRNDGGGYYRGGRYDYDQTKKRGRRRGRGGWIIFPGGGFGGGGSSGGGFGDFGGGGFGGFGGGGGGFDGGGAFGDW